MSRFHQWVVSLSAALLALVLAGPPLYGAISATIQHAEDAAHTSGDIGTEVLCKRTDTAASSAGTDGDYATLNCGSDGSLWIEWKTPAGNTLIDATFDAVQVALDHVVTIQGRTPTVKEWYTQDSDDAEDNLALVTTASGTITVTYIKIECSPATTATVLYRIGFGSADIAASSATGASGIIASGWIDKDNSLGGSFTWQGAVSGAAGEDLRYDLDDPVGGACRLIVHYIED